jgi:hypothetical protein
MSKKIEYNLAFASGLKESFFVMVDPETFITPDDDKVAAPDWALLENNKCSHCPYQSSEKKYCPVAKNLSKASEAFKDHRSFEEITCFVTTDARFYGKKTDLQTALFSLFGLIMASSSCVHLNLFKPMARFHLPFSTSVETIVRALGMYLTSEYLKTLEDQNHKIDLQGLLDKYADIEKLNQGIIKRIRTLKGGDANKNAIVILDSFASLLPLQISSGLTEIKTIFAK